MILPMELFHNPDDGDLKKHNETLKKFCEEVAKEILPAFSDGRRLHVDQMDRAASGYALGLAQVLKHVHLVGQKKRRDRVKALLMEGAGVLAAKSGVFTPSALELVIASSYCLAYPGGVDIYATLPDCYVYPGLRGDPAGFARTVDNMEMYWNDALEGIRRADLLAALELAGEKRRQIDTTYMERLKVEATSKEYSHYRRLLVKRNAEWRRAEGDQSQTWSRFARYWMAARGAVQIPEIKE